MGTLRERFYNVKLLAGRVGTIKAHLGKNLFMCVSKHMIKKMYMSFI